MRNTTENTNAPKNSTSVWIKHTEEQQAEAALLNAVNKHNEIKTGEASAKAENTNTPKTSANTGKLWGMLTDEQKAEVTVIAAAGQRNRDLERFQNGGAPDLTAEEV